MMSLILSKNFLYSSIFLCAFSFYPKESQSLVEEPKFLIENMHCNIGKVFFEFRNTSSLNIHTCFLKNGQKDCLVIEKNKTIIIEKSIKDDMSIFFIKDSSLFFNYFLTDESHNLDSIKKWYLEKEKYSFSYKLESGTCGYAFNK